MTSEAAMYQEIRRHWKKCRNNAQRRYEHARWELEHQQKHPAIRKAVAAIGSRDWNSVVIPIAREENLRQDMYDSRVEVMKYQDLLDRFKLEKENA